MLTLKKKLIFVMGREFVSDLSAVARRFLEAFSELRKGINPIDSPELIAPGKKTKIKTSSTVTENLVLLDQFPIPQWLAINSVIAQEIANTLGASIRVFAFRRPSKYSRDIHLNFGLSDFIIIRLNLLTLKKIRKEYLNVLSHLDSNKNLIEYRIDGVPIGLDIYESILRLGRATISISDWQTYRVIYLALKQYYYFEYFFEAKRVLSVIVSHDNYVGPGLLAHMAFKYKVPVILANTISLSMPTEPFQLYRKFERFQIYADSIPSTELKDGIFWAKTELEKRVSGAIGIGMNYQIKSAFITTRIVRQTRNINETKILVLTHDFFDNPHGYGRMLFADFYLWLEFLGNLSRETSYEWYIKPHRDYSDIEFDILKGFVSRYPHIQLVDPDTSYHQLKDEGVTFALTCYGSAGHELPLLGYTVINASYNPHISYKFNIHATSVLDYESIIRNLPKYALDDLKIVEVFEYYYLQKRYLEQDSLMGISQSKLNEIGQGPYATERTIEYLMAQRNEIEKATRKVLKNTINNRLVFEFEKNLPAVSQVKVELNATNALFYEKLGVALS